MAEQEKRVGLLALDDALVIAISQLVDDAQAARRDPSHSDLDHLIKRHQLVEGDPVYRGQTVGKAKRVRGVLLWGMENDLERGSAFAAALLNTIRGHGGFRADSPSYVGSDAIKNCQDAFSSGGYLLSADGHLQTAVLDSLSGYELTAALRAYARRAQKGAEDAALLVGTGKDLMEAVAKHVVQEKFGAAPSHSNFPTLLGQAFVAVGMATPDIKAQPNEHPRARVQRAMYDAACSVNGLRNREGIGHGRPWVPGVSPSEARHAIEISGLVSEFLLDALE